MNCNPHFHKVTALTVDGDTVNMTVTNDTNVSSLDFFELVLCVNPNTVVTGDPLAYTVTINGEAVPLLNKYSLPINTNRLCTRKRYYGSYVNLGTTAWVILWNTPDCARFAI